MITRKKKLVSTRMSPVVRVTTEAGIEVRDCFHSLAYILVLRKEINKQKGCD